MARPCPAVVANPTKIGEGSSVRDEVTAALEQAGCESPLWLETAQDDPGYGATEQALERGADLVLAVGGDGTVRAVLTVLAGSKVPLAVVPFGTGNLLARNLGIPLNDVAAAVEIAVDGADRVIDVGRIEPTDPNGRHERFAVMAGVGMDAAIVRDAPEAVKARVGWAAYLLSTLKHVRRSGVQLQVVIDGGRPYRTRAQSVVVGNLGKLQGGVELLQDAVPDDGVLDIAVVSSRGLVDLGRIVSRVLTHREHVDHRLVTMQGAHIEVSLRRPQPRQVDGDLLDPSPRLVVEVEPAAVIVRVPRPPETP